MYRETMAGIARIVVMWLAMIPFSTSVTVEDVQECSALNLIFGRLVCSSVNRFYRQCIVPGATSLHIIKLNKHFSQNTCEFKDTFGFFGNVVWVNDGCSGEFFVCFEGVRVSSDYPELLTVTRASGTTTGYDVDVVRGPTLAGTDEVIIYIIIGIVVLLLMTVGLCLCCIVKRRQKRDKARRLAEERQASLHRTYDSVVTISHGSLSGTPDHGSSIEQLAQYRSDHNQTPSSYRWGGSVCSSRSSLSGSTSGSGYLAGPSGRRSQTPTGISSLSPDDKQHNDSSTVDSRSLQRVSSDSNNVGESSRCASTSQSSLDSSREGNDKHHMNEISLECELKGTSVRLCVRGVKYNTVGSNGRPKGVEKPIENGTMTLPINRGETRAIIHEQPRDIKDENRDIAIEDNCADFESSEMKMPNDSHYQSIDECKPAVENTNQVQQPTERLRTAMFKPIRTIPNGTTLEHGQPPTQLRKPLCFRKEPNTAIYAKINKATLRQPLPFNKHKPNGTVVSFSVIGNITSSAATSSSRSEGPYASMETFKPINTTSSSRSEGPYASMDTFKPINTTSSSRSEGPYASMETFKPISTTAQHPTNTASGILKTTEC